MNNKQLFEREYMGTFEPRRGPPRRPKLAAVLAALNGWPVDARAFQYEIDHKKRLHLYGYAVYADDAPTIFFLDDLSPAEAWELLAARDLIPASWVDHPRRFGVRTTRGRTCYNCPPISKSKHCPLCDNTRIVAATLSASPDTLADVVAFASLDHEAVDRAELLAIEHVGTARPICWRFGAVDPETASAHGYRQEPGQAIAGLGFGFALAPRDTPLHPYKILVCPPL